LQFAGLSPGMPLFISVSFFRPVIRFHPPVGDNSEPSTTTLLITHHPPLDHILLDWSLFSPVLFDHSPLHPLRCSGFQDICIVLLSHVERHPSTFPRDTFLFAGACFLFSLNSFCSGSCGEAYDDASLKTSLIFPHRQTRTARGLPLDSSVFVNFSALAPSRLGALVLTCPPRPDFQAEINRTFSSCWLRRYVLPCLLSLSGRRNP